MRKIQCQSCRAFLSSGNPYYYRQDGIKLCTPCRQADWRPGTWPTGAFNLPKMEEHPEVTRAEDDARTAHALAPQVCECEAPIPAADEEGTCIICAKYIAPTWAAAA